MRALLAPAVLAAVLQAPVAAGADRAGHAARRYPGYVFFHFTGEGAADVEQVYPAVGRGEFETTDLATGDWRPVADHELPGRPRHGTVLPVTRSGLEGVRAAFP